LSAAAAAVGSSGESAPLTGGEDSEFRIPHSKFLAAAQIFTISCENSKILSQ
jgi:hypothetical protein